MLKTKVSGTSRIVMERVKGTGRKFLLLALVSGGAEIVRGAGSVSALSFDDGSMWLSEI